MSDMRPVGVPITLGDKEWHFLFTLNVMDEIQSHYDMNVLDALNRLFPDGGKEPVEDIRYFTMVLVNDEVERMLWSDPECSLRKVTEQQAGWLVSWDNINAVRAAILKAFKISMPDSEDDDPNRKSGKRK